MGLMTFSMMSRSICLFVTSGLRGTGIIDECKTNFENAGVSVTVYDKVESNPKDYNVMDAYKAFADGECDGFVSIGGGSSHDTTKGARVVAAHDGTVDVDSAPGRGSRFVVRLPAADPS